VLIDVLPDKSLRLDQMPVAPNQATTTNVVRQGMHQTTPENHDQEYTHQ
jgi:hypothetical protein